MNRLATPPTGGQGNGYRWGKVAMGGPGNARFIVGDMNTEGLVCLSTLDRGIVHGAVTP